MARWKREITQEHRLEKGKGGGGGGSSTLNPQIYELAKQGVFKPFTITTGAGSAYGNEGDFGSQANAQYAALQQQALAGANQLLPQLQATAGRELTPFQFNTNADQLTQDYFNQQSALLQPQFAQQRQQLQNDLFGSGRMGLSLAGSAVGADGGMVNPDAFGLARAQSQTLADVAAQSRQQALADAQTRYGLESGVYNTNLGAQTQQLQNQLAASQGLFGMSSGVSDLELALLQAGMQGEQLRASTYADAAAAAGVGASQPQQKESGKGLLGDLALTGASIYATTKGLPASDERLKDNVVKVGSLPNGINVYIWEWNKTAKDNNLDSYPPIGVIAQEVLEVMPNAVIKDDKGFYRVDYSEVLK